MMARVIINIEDGLTRLISKSLLSNKAWVGLDAQACKIGFELPHHVAVF